MKSKLSNSQKQRKSHIHFVIMLLKVLTVIQLGVFSACVWLTSLFENMPLFDSFYLSVITLLTVGYGDMHPVTVEGRYVAMVIASTGAIYLIFLAAFLTIILLEGKIFELGSEYLMNKRINTLENHIIVCGLGRAGSAAIQQFVAENISFVGIDIDSNHCNEFRLAGHLVIEGDATHDVILKQAGIEKAKSVIAILPDDGNNLLITLAAKDLNKNVRIIARANRKESELRLIRAGADWSLAVGFSGGVQLAMAAIRPAAGGFVHQIMDFSNLNLKLEEIRIDEGSVLANKKIIETKLRPNFNVQILSIVRKEKPLVNPNPNEKLLPNDIITIFGATKSVLNAIRYIKSTEM